MIFRSRIIWGCRNSVVSPIIKSITKTLKNEFSANNSAKAAVTIWIYMEEVGTISQGKTVEEALENLKEATELYMEEFPLKEESKPFMTVFDD